MTFIHTHMYMQVGLMLRIIEAWRDGKKKRQQGSGAPGHGGGRGRDANDRDTTSTSTPTTTTMARLHNHNPEEGIPVNTEEVSGGRVGGTLAGWAGGTSSEALATALPPHGPTYAPSTALNVPHLLPPQLQNSSSSSSSSSSSTSPAVFAPVSVPALAIARDVVAGIPFRSHDFNYLHHHRDDDAGEEEEEDDKHFIAGTNEGAMVPSQSTAAVSGVTSAGAAAGGVKSLSMVEGQCDNERAKDVARQSGTLHSRDTAAVPISRSKTTPLKVGGKKVVPPPLQ